MKKPTLADQILAVWGTRGNWRSALEVFEQLEAMFPNPGRTLDSVRIRLAHMKKKKVLRQRLVRVRVFRPERHQPSTPGVPPRYFAEEPEERDAD